MSASLGHQLMSPVDAGEGLDWVDRGDGTTMFGDQQPCPRAHALQVAAEMCFQFTDAHSIQVYLLECDHKCNMDVVTTVSALSGAGIYSGDP